MNRFFLFVLNNRLMAMAVMVGVVVLGIAR